MSLLPWLYGVVLVKYRCPFHGVTEVTMHSAPDYPERVRCLIPVRVSGMSSGGSGPDNGHDTTCGLSAKLVTA